MKDRPPSSYGAVYVPPHHRLRSVITTPNYTSAASIPPKKITTTTIAAPKARTNGARAYYQTQHQELLHKQKLQPDSYFDDGGSVFVSDEVSDRDYNMSSNPGASVSDNLDEWKRKLTMLLSDNKKQELVTREKKDRRDFEDISALASRMGLHSHLYPKVAVFSKVSLPNYRFDLDDRRPQREVTLPLGLLRRVETYLGDFLSQKSRTKESFPDVSFSRSSSSGGIGTDEGLFEQPEPVASNNAVVEKVLWRRSLQLRDKQQVWQKSCEGRKVMELRRSLPGYKEKDALLKAISKNQVVIISGQTGCGKTTQIPQFILESEIEAAGGAICSIICTQPRWISAMSVSERVASEIGEKLGSWI